jgi:hypothetical protein
MEAAGFSDTCRYLKTVRRQNAEDIIKFHLHEDVNVSATRDHGIATDVVKIQGDEEND